MANINQVWLEGNLTASAVLSRWGDGTPYARFTIANNEYFKTSEGKYDSIPSYIDCIVKGAYAESMSKYLLKGRHLSVTGRLKQNRWQDEQGNKRSAIVIKVSEISLAPTGNGSGHPAEQETPPTEVPADVGSDMFDGNEEIPF